MKSAVLAHKFAALGASLTIVCRRTLQMLRLMVGVGDYAAYVEHMRVHHREIPPMTQKDYFRYCQNARYPSKDGRIKRCPC